MPKLPLVYHISSNKEDIQYTVYHLQSSLPSTIYCIPSTVYHLPSTPLPVPSTIYCVSCAMSSEDESSKVEGYVLGGQSDTLSREGAAEADDLEKLEFKNSHEEEGDDNYGSVEGSEQEDCDDEENRDDDNVGDEEPGDDGINVQQEDEDSVESLTEEQIAERERKRDDKAS